MLLSDAPVELPSTSKEIEAYLRDTAGLKIPVLPKFYTQAVRCNRLMQDLLTPTDGSLLPASLTTLLSKAPEDHGSELTTTVGICSFMDSVFPALNTYSTTHLVYKIYLNKSETGTSSCIMKERTRPDTSLVSNSCLLLGANGCSRVRNLTSSRLIIRQQQLL
jgi:hypothetical protein